MAKSGNSAQGGTSVGYTTGGGSARRAAVLAAVVLLGGGLGQRWIERLLIAADSVPVALERSLSSLPMQIGLWRGTEVPMDKRVIEVAGNDAQVYRRYVNEQTAEVVDFYLAFAARPAKMLGHRPQVCYPANGWMPVETNKERIAAADGSGFDVLVHRFSRQQPAPEAVVVLNYYILGGRYATDWTDFWGPGWRLPNLSRDPSIYVAQIQISCATRDVVGLHAAAALVERFAAEVASMVDAILPRSAISGAGAEPDVASRGVGPSERQAGFDP